MCCYKGRERIFLRDYFGKMKGRDEGWQFGQDENKRFKDCVLHIERVGTAVVYGREIIDAALRGVRTGIFVCEQRAVADFVPLQVYIGYISDC